MVVMFKNLIKAGTDFDLWREVAQASLNRFEELGIVSLYKLQRISVSAALTWNLVASGWIESKLDIQVGRRISPPARGYALCACCAVRSNLVSSKQIQCQSCPGDSQVPSLLTLYWFTPYLQNFGGSLPGTRKLTLSRTDDIILKHAPVAQWGSFVCTSFRSG